MEKRMSWTREDAREFDRRMIEEVGIPGVVLMENAGRSAADWILAHLDRLDLQQGGRVAVLCGRGNNGGDGYVVARHLALGGLDVVIGEVGGLGSMSEDCAVFQGVCSRMGLELVALSGAEASVAALGEVGLLVDGVLGVGFRPPLRGDCADLLMDVAAACSQWRAPIIALDCPSGLDVDTGILSEGGLRADVSLTFVAEKAGFSAEGAAAALGEVVVLPIGAPAPAAGRSTSSEGYPPRG